LLPCLVARSDEVCPPHRELTHEGICRFSPDGKLGQDGAKAVIKEAFRNLRDEFDAIDMRTQRHLSRVLKAFRGKRVGTNMFQTTDGYGHGDLGLSKAHPIPACTPSKTLTHAMTDRNPQ
jgi:hypothetical protein